MIVHTHLPLLEEEVQIWLQVSCPKFCSYWKQLLINWVHAISLLWRFSNTQSYHCDWESSWWVCVAWRAVRSKILLLGNWMMTLLLVLLWPYSCCFFAISFLSTILQFYQGLGKSCIAWRSSNVCLDVYSAKFLHSLLSLHNYMTVAH